MTLSRLLFHGHTVLHMPWVFSCSIAMMVFWVNTCNVMKKAKVVGSWETRFLQRCPTQVDLLPAQIRTCVQTNAASFGENRRRIIISLWDKGSSAGSQCSVMKLTPGGSKFNMGSKTIKKIRVQSACLYARGASTRTAARRTEIKRAVCWLPVD